MAELIERTSLIDPRLIFEKAGVEEGQTVAELGCGHEGYYIFLLARFIGDSGKLYAVDIQKRVLANIAARARTENCSIIETVWSDLERYGAARIPNESAHHAFLINTLFQTTDHNTVMREAYRMLRHGGRLTVVEWLPSGVPFGPSIERRVRPEALELLANEVGFRTATRFSAGPYHYALIFEK